MREESAHKKLSSPQLQWSLDVGGKDAHVMHSLPRSSTARLSLAEDQWRKLPVWSLARKEQQQQQSFVEVAVFLSSSSNKQIEMTVHDPDHEKSTSYQLDIHDEVLKIELVELPLGTTNPSTRTKKDVPGTKEQAKGRGHDVEVFGVLLVLATVEGISIFSLVFTRSITPTTISNFVLAECNELSDCDHVTNHNSVLLRDRRVRDLKSRIFRMEKSVSFGAPEDTTTASSREEQPVLVIVAASLPRKPNSPTAPNRQQFLFSHNVDAFVYGLKDHRCPLFRYTAGKNPVSTNGLTSFNLLKDVGKVKSLGFLGNNLMGHGRSSLIVTVLLLGELKLVPMVLQPKVASRSNNNKMKVQTILLAGICAHPTISDLGEAVLLKSDDDIDTAIGGGSICRVAILCQPKLHQIGFKRSSYSLATSTPLLSARNTISFSPVKDVTEDSSTTAPRHFFPSDTSQATENVSSVSNDEDWQTPRLHTSSLHGIGMDKPKSRNAYVISPDSDHGNTRHSDLMEQQVRVSRPEFSANVDVGKGQPARQKSQGTPSRKYNTTPESILTANGISPLVGLHLLDAKSSSKSVHDDSTIMHANTSSITSAQVLDLTGKWPSGTACNVDDSSLSLMSAFDSDESGAHSEYDLLFKQPTQLGNPLLTPINLNRARVGPRSALKNIQCTTLLTREETSESLFTRDHFSHVIFVNIEQEEKTDSGNSHQTNQRGETLLRFSFSTAVLPQDLAKFDCAALEWERGSDSKRLIVLTSDGLSDNLSINLAELSWTRSTSKIEVASSTSYHMQPVFEKLGTKRKSKIACFSMESLSLKRLSNHGVLGLRFLISQQVVEDDKNTATLESPINMSTTEATRICLASATVPLATSAKHKTSFSVDGNAAIIQTLGDVMGFLGRLEERLEKIEEAMRTV